MRTLINFLNRFQKDDITLLIKKIVGSNWNYKIYNKDFIYLDNEKINISSFLKAIKFLALFYDERRYYLLKISKILEITVKGKLDIEVKVIYISKITNEEVGIRMRLSSERITYKDVFDILSEISEERISFLNELWKKVGYSVSAITSNLYWESIRNGTEKIGLWSRYMKKAHKMKSAKSFSYAFTT